MKVRIVRNLIISLLFLIGGILAIIYVQIPQEVEAQGEIGTLGLSATPSGQQVLYMFTGVIDEEDTPKVTTVVHCTNHGDATVDITVQMFDENGGAILAPAGATSLDPNKTMSFSPSPSDGLETQTGSGWVLAPDSVTAEVICTVRVRDMENASPSFMAKLHLFDGEGNCVGNNCGGNNPNPGPSASGDIFLPIILKDN